jgi:hypothetical protein
MRTWGFRTIAGEYVGGGLFTKVRLDADESIIETVVATRAGPWWFDRHGYLVLTERRLVHTPYRWPATFTGNKPTSIPYADISKCTAERRNEPDKPASFLIDALVIQAGNRSEVFWPAAQADRLDETIERLPNKSRRECDLEV